MISIVDAPSVLGLFHRGVETLPMPCTGATSLVGSVYPAPLAHPTRNTRPSVIR